MMFFSIVRIVFQILNIFYLPMHSILFSRFICVTSVTVVVLTSFLTWSSILTVNLTNINIPTPSWESVGIAYGTLAFQVGFHPHNLTIILDYLCEILNVYHFTVWCPPNDTISTNGYAKQKWCRKSNHSGIHGYLILFTIIFYCSFKLFLRCDNVTNNLKKTLTANN